MKNFIVLSLVFCLALVVMAVPVAAGQVAVQQTILQAPVAQQVVMQQATVQVQVKANLIQRIRAKRQAVRTYRQSLEVQAVPVIVQTTTATCVGCVPRVRAYGIVR